MNTYAKITGLGGHVPSRAVDNATLSQWVDTSDQWIQTRTGIRQRHFAGETELAGTLALPAAKQAMAQAGIEGADLDMIVFATTTPDRVYPATACLLQAELNAAPCAAFDVQAVCSGFLYALGIGEAMVAAGRAKTVLIVGAEVFSSTLDWKDRATCVLFGDGAGAAILQADSSPGVMAVRLYADGRYADNLTVNARIRNGELQGDPYTRMDGGTVFRFAVEKMVESAQDVIAKSGSAPDWLVLHQANSRIIEAVRKRLKMSAERCVNCVADYANTSAASIPLALCASSSRFSAGDNVLMAAAGGGFTWGAVMVEWG
ncbi:ketoacyl-ACP synthase III [Candidatus Persebacteraceae bacterium Df01]|jgi:3-oxoacyl-[acyl-carrier-protein] synthase-3|uniref:Beta-ketoacyl-[acyl-carrier-protein] synthase III n=1 Tax=Candidatus Doriopsillibacter californiensis TaxID=2970740 RepID=A0ABT7QKT8_9GAMM|nr:ketoacyl-ACP synthase III [Candidatus Persebacteraceae bacterium Df01]